MRLPAVGAAVRSAGAAGKQERPRKKEPKSFVLQCFVTDTLDALSIWPPPISAHSAHPPRASAVSWSASRTAIPSEWHGGVRVVVALPHDAPPPLALATVWKRVVAAQALSGLPLPSREPEHFELRPAGADGHPLPAVKLNPQAPLRTQLQFPYSAALCLRPHVAQKEALQAAEGRVRRLVTDACHRTMARCDMWRFLLLRDLGSRHAVSTQRDADLNAFQTDEGVQRHAALCRLLVRRAFERKEAVSADWAVAAAGHELCSSSLRMHLGEEGGRRGVSAAEAEQRAAIASCHQLESAELSLLRSLQSRWKAHTKWLATAERHARTMQWRALHAASFESVEPGARPSTAVPPSPKPQPVGRPASAAAALRCGWEPEQSLLWEDPLLVGGGSDAAMSWAVLALS